MLLVAFWKWCSHKSPSFIDYSRWVRLLLSREFDLDDTLVIWTAIFADSVNLDLIDSLCVALLTYIREFCQLIVQCVGSWR